MPLPILQCEDCKFNVEWIITEDNFPGIYMCEKYPEGIPLNVEDGIDDCPKYEKREL